MKEVKHYKNTPYDTLMTINGNALILYDGRIYSKGDSIIYLAKFNDSTYCMVINNIELFTYPYKKFNIIKKEIFAQRDNKNFPFKIKIDSSEMPYTLTAFTNNDTLEVILPINRTDINNWEIIKGRFNKNDFFSPFKIGTDIDKIKSLIRVDKLKLDKKNLIICLMYIGELSNDTILKMDFNNRTLERKPYWHHYILYFENRILKSIEYTSDFPCKIRYSYMENHKLIQICK